MHHVGQEDLPFVGSSYQFVGAEQGGTQVSVFLFQGKPGSGPGPHRHPYDEIQFIREGRGLWTVDGKTFEGGAGDIFVIKAGEIHSFKPLAIRPWYSLTCTSVRSLFRKTCRGVVAARCVLAVGAQNWGKAGVRAARLFDPTLCSEKGAALTVS